MLFYVNSTLKPLISFTGSIVLKKAKIHYAPSFSLYPLLPVNVASTLDNIAAKRFLKKVDKVWVFTKHTNLNKLYIDNNSGIFLSAGIVLKFINLSKSRFLKKRLRT